jgi:hypothetical protein
MEFTAQEQQELERLAKQASQLQVWGLWPYPDLGKASLIAWLNLMCQATIPDKYPGDSRSRMEAARDACQRLAEKLEHMTEHQVTELHVSPQTATN